jgi:hypothetical protein
MNNTKPKVKLLTLWMLDVDYYKNDIPNHIISNGIWETQGVEEKSNEWGINRIYTLVCVDSHNKNLKKGTKVKMAEAVIIELCHRVKLIHLPKYKSLMKKYIPKEN